ncbi:MAG: phenylacetate--CoA ligase family protein [Acidimicrobiia bacterium]
MGFFDRHTETTSRAGLRDVQFVRLAELLATVYGRNRFYTDKMDRAGVTPDTVRSLEDLATLPFTTKEELVAAAEQSPPFGTNLTFPEDAYTRIHQTSGTTGRPLKVVDTEESWDWWGRCWGYVLSGAGVTATDRLFLPFSFGPFIGFWAAVEGAREVGALLIPGGGADSVQRLHLIEELGVTALCATPTYALRLAEVARAEGVDTAELPVRRLVLAGEPGALVPEIRRRIESAWGAECYDHAGASEVGAHSFECEARTGGTHVIESEFIVEVVDPADLRPVQAGGEGELVITNLGRVGFPVIRYRTGDLVRLNTDPCECGRTFARFDGGILGRADDMVVVRGVNVFPSAIENLIRQVDAVEEYQVTVSRGSDLASLSIAIEVGEGADAEAARHAVARNIQNELALRPEVTVVASDSLPRFELKARRFHLVD